MKRREWKRLYHESGIEYTVLNLSVKQSKNTYLGDTVLWS